MAIISCKTGDCEQSSKEQVDHGKDKTVALALFGPGALFVVWRHFVLDVANE